MIVGKKRIRRLNGAASFDDHQDSCFHLGHVRPTTTSAGQIWTSLLCAAFVSMQLPLSTPAMSLHAEGHDASVVRSTSGGAASAGMSSTGSSASTLYSFSSASAARLLVDPAPSSTRSSPGALRQLSKQRSMQDARLEQCHESGGTNGVFDWDQCFFYGTGGSPGGGSTNSWTVPNLMMNAPPLSEASSMMQQTMKPSKANVPTW